MAVYSQQAPNQTWYFGKFGGLRFSNSVPAPVTGKLDTWEGCAVYSDPATGNPILYSDGRKLFQADGSVVTGGDALKSGISSTQCCIFIPDPANAQRVYLFTTPDLTGVGSTQTKAYYSHISLQGTPSVITANVELQDNMSEKIAGTQHCADNSYWVLYHHKSQSRIIAHKVTSTGVSTTPVVSTYTNLNNYYNVGAMKVSPDGSKLVVVSEADGSSYLQTVVLFDFNLQTGQATNPKFIAKNKCFGNYGAAFSPNSKRLFTTGTLDRQQSSESALFEFDISSDNEATIAASMWTLPLGTRKLFGLQLGPDGKIYVVADRPSQLDVINKPNMMGAEVGYSLNVLNQSAKTVLGLPTMIDYNIAISNDTVMACPSSGITIGHPPLPGYTYAWTPSIGLNNAAISNPLAKPSVPTTYTLFVTNPFGCQTRQTIHVGLLPPVNANYEVPSSICKGGKVQLKASGATKYSWFPATGLSSTTIPNPIASPDSTTVYYLVASNTQCSDTIPIRVDVVPFPIADAGKDKTTCPGGSIEIGVTPKSGHTYYWLQEKYVSNAYLSKTIATPPSNNFPYILKVTNEYGCTSYDTVIVKIENTLKAKTSSDTTICRGDGIRLQASGGSKYQWFMGVNISDTSSPKPFVVPDVNTKYGVVVSNGNCIDTAYIQVNVIQGVVANAGQDQSTCPGESLQLGVASQNGVNYSWTPNTFLNNASSSNPVCTPTSSIQYVLTVTSQAGCISQDTVMVNVADKLQISLVDDTALCPGNSLTLRPSGAQNYIWYPPIGVDDTTSKTPTFTPLQTTTYYVKAKNGNCSGFDSVTIRVLSLPQPDAGNNVSICPGDSTLLTASGATSYTWFTSRLSTISTGDRVLVSPANTTLYYVEGSNGSCFNLDSVLVTVKPIPVIKASGDTIICKGNSGTLIANGGDSYEWQDHPTIVSKNGAQIIVEPLQDTYYSFKGMRDGCSSSVDSIFVRVRASLPIIKNADSVTCTKTPFVISLYPSAGITVSGNCSVLSQTSDSLIISAEKSGFISVKGLRNGCSSQDSFYLNVLDIPIVKLPSDTTICKGDKLVINAEGALQYKWESNSPFIQQQGNTIIIDSLISDIRVKVTGDNGLCSSSDEIVVSVKDPQTARYALTTTEQIVPGQPITLSLSIPSLYENSRIAVKYDPSCADIQSHSVSYGSLKTNVISKSPNEYVLEILNPSKSNGLINYVVNTFLPSSIQQSTEFTMAWIDGVEPCTDYELKGCIVPYSPTCAWSLRPIQSKASYQCSIMNNAIHIRTPFKESMHVYLTTLDGRVIIDESLAMSDGEERILPIPRDLSIGIYALSIHGILWHDSFLLPIHSN